MKGQKSKKEPFFIVPNRVFELELNPYELSVLLYLMMRADYKTHTSFPSEKEIGRSCGMSLATVKRTLRALTEKELIEVQNQFSQSQNGLSRQTANRYILRLCESPPAAHTDTPLSSVGHSPQLTQTREINKTKPNITILNITKPTEQKESEAAEEKERLLFIEKKRECFEILKNERGIDEETIALLDRAITHLWFKEQGEYEGKKYVQGELHRLLTENISPDILCASVEFLSGSSEVIRAPVAYLAKCILGMLINGVQVIKRSKVSLPTVAGEEINEILNGAEEDSFDVNEFFAAALRKSYEDM